MVLDVLLYKDGASASLLLVCIGVPPGSVLNDWFQPDGTVLGMVAMGGGTWLRGMSHQGHLFDHYSPESLGLFLLTVCQGESGFTVIGCKV